MSRMGAYAASRRRAPRRGRGRSSLDPARSRAPRTSCATACGWRAAANTTATRAGGSRWRAAGHADRRHRGDRPAAGVGAGPGAAHRRRPPVLGGGRGRRQAVPRSRASRPRICWCSTGGSPPTSRSASATAWRCRWPTTTPSSGRRRCPTPVTSGRRRRRCASSTAGTGRRFAGGAGWRWFVFKPERGFDFQAPTAFLSYWQSVSPPLEEPGAEWDWRVTASFEGRRFRSGPLRGRRRLSARRSPPINGWTASSPRPPRSTAPATCCWAAGCAGQLNDSNSYGESLLRGAVFLRGVRAAALAAVPGRPGRAGRHPLRATPSRWAATHAGAFLSIEEEGRSDAPRWS